MQVEARESKLSLFFFFFFSNRIYRGARAPKNEDYAVSSGGVLLLPAPRTKNKQASAPHQEVLDMNMTNSTVINYMS